METNKKECVMDEECTVDMETKNLLDMVFAASFARNFHCFRDQVPDPLAASCMALAAARDCQDSLAYALEEEADMKGRALAPQGPRVKFIKANGEEFWTDIPNSPHPLPMILTPRYVPGQGVRVLTFHRREDSSGRVEYVQF